VLIATHHHQSQHSRHSSSKPQPKHFFQTPRAHHPKDFNNKPKNSNQQHFHLQSTYAVHVKEGNNNPSNPSKPSKPSNPPKPNPHHPPKTQPDRDEDKDTETFNLSLVEYVNYLYHNQPPSEDHNQRLRYIINTFGKRLIDVSFISRLKPTLFSKSLLKFKYFDHCRLWSKWARESRGVILRFDETLQRFVCDKMMLLRGAEVLTKLHVQANILESQDLSLSDKPTTDSNIIAMDKPKVLTSGQKHLDLSQRETIQCHLEGKPLTGYLSFKSDGSLLSISLYKLGTATAQFYETITNECGDEFAQAMLQIAKDMKLPFIPVIGSQGTLWLSKDMQSYMATAILEGACEMSAKEVRQLAMTYSPIQLLQHKQYGYRFFEKLRSFYEHITSSRQMSFADTLRGMTLSFEAVCQDRQDSWPNATIHTELAIAYPKAALKLLGCTFYHDQDRQTVKQSKEKMSDSSNKPPQPHHCPDYVYKAHFQLHDACVQSGLEEPQYWEISHAKDVEVMMRDLSRAVMGQISESEFYRLHPPASTVTQELQQQQQQQQQQLDYEGWILYRELPDGTLDYSKIKSQEYYHCHKLHVSNVPALIQMAHSKNPQIARIFPLAKVIQEVVNGLEEKLIEVCVELKSILEGQSVTMHSGGLRMKTSAYYQQAQQKLLQAVDPSCRRAFEKPNHSLEVKMKMLLNTETPVWREVCYVAFHQRFPMLKAITTGKTLTHIGLKKLLMQIEIWKPVDCIRSTIKKLVTGLLEPNSAFKSKSELDAFESFIALAAR
jgi:hypothetical protein